VPAHMFYDIVRKLPDGSQIVLEAVAGTAVLAITAATPALALQASDAGNSADIIVTATKRNESVRQIAAPISAVSGDQLQKMNANSLGDYIARLPGVVFNDYQPGVSEVVIRGIAATTYHEQGQTTVGYYMNEVNLVEPGFPIGIPDVDTFDMDRVEVLRGPQGTLFGSSTLGGLVNYVVKTADVTKFDMGAEALVGSTKNASGTLNTAGKLMVNVPIIADKLAVRVMALQRYDAGYIDNIGTTPSEKATNDFRTRGLRGSVVFTPAPGTKITYLAAYQKSRLDDQTYISTAGTYIRNTPREEPQRTSFFLNSLRLDQEVADAGTLTVLGSVDKKKNYTLFTDPYGYVTGIFTGPDAAFDYANANANIKTIEARFASKDNGGPFRWLIGTAYMRATKFSFDQMFAPGAEAYINAHPNDFAYPGSVLAPNDRIYGYLSDTLNTDFGIFGEATWRPVKGLEITAGGRYYSTRAEGDVTNKAGFVSGSPVDLSGHTDQKDHGFTPKASLAFRPNSHFLAYMTYSRGYRVGGANPPIPVGACHTDLENLGITKSPDTFSSDTVSNYEVGAKNKLLGGRMSLDSSVYHLEWNNIQQTVNLPICGIRYTTNLGKAASNGFDAQMAFQLNEALGFELSLGYNDAYYTTATHSSVSPSSRIVINKGDSLGATPWRAAGAIQYNWTLLDHDAFFRLDDEYSSGPNRPTQSLDPVNASFDPALLPAPATNFLSARASINLGAYNVALFMDNVLNAHPQLTYSHEARGDLYQATTFRPRTMGVTATFRY